MLGMGKAGMEGGKPNGVLYSGSGAGVGEVCREIKMHNFLDFID